MLAVGGGGRCIPAFPGYAYGLTNLNNDSNKKLVRRWDSKC